MEARLWTVHRKGKRDVEVIDDPTSLFALILPPAWAIWHRCWVTLAAMIVLPVLAGLYSKFAISPVMYGIGLILLVEGGAVRRWEMRLSGWREVGVVEARSPEGAEEQWITGQTA